MSHDHIGIPKFIQKGFSIDNKTNVYNIKENKSYITSVDRLGTEKDYYDEEVETKILAKGVEYQFSEFYHQFCSIKEYECLKNLVDSNVKLLEQFFSFMFLRAKKALEQVKQNCLFTILFGEMTHSLLLKIQSNINTNPLSIIGDKYSFYPLINFSDTLFINNSIGFGILINESKEYSFVIPFNTKRGIIISGNTNLPNTDLFYISSAAEEKADAINKCIIRTEKVLGNGFFFGTKKSKIEEYIEYFNATN